MTETPDSEASSSPTLVGGVVSVITRTLNRPRLLARAVESVLGQSYGNWQHVIVNDGGDASALAEFLAPYEARYKGRLTIVNHPKSLGMQAATNSGLKVATGEFVAVHDDDDSWHEEFLSAAVSFLEAKGQESIYQGVVCQTVKVWEDIDAQGNVVEVSREPYLPLKEVTLFRIGYENPFAPIAFVYRRSVHKTIGLFNERFDVAGDMDFNVRFLLHWEIGVIGRPLAYYHWRRKAGSGMGNSVMAADVHALRFNEFLNHYLREQAKQSPDGIGLALNVGRHAVTASTRLATLLEQVAALQEACEVIRQSVQPVPGQTERLTDLKAHLNSVSDALNEGVVGRLADLKEHLNSVSGTLDEAVVGRLSDLKAHLDSVSGVLRYEVDDRLSDLKAHLDSVSGVLNSIVSEQRERENALRSEWNESAKSQHAEWMAVRDEILSIRNELHKWRLQERAWRNGFSLGPIRICWGDWSKAKNGKDSE